MQFRVSFQHISEWVGGVAPRKSSEISPCLGSEPGGGGGSRHLQTTPGVLLVDGLLHLSSALVRVAGAPAAGVSACPPEFCPSSPSG